MQKIFYTLLFLALFVSCAPFKMSVSDELKASNDEYNVKGRNGILIKQKLSFGEFRTEIVKRSWTSGTSTTRGFGFGYPGTADYTNIISNEYIRRKQTVFFSLADDQPQRSEVYCISRFNAKEFTIGDRENSVLNIALDIFGKGGSSESYYYVQLYAAENEKPWQMMIDNQAAQAEAKTYTGVLTRDRNHYYTIVPVTKLEKNGKSGNILGGSIGFEFRDPQGRAIAAVSLIDNGMVFLAKTSTNERFVLANACAALLLQQQIEN
jgi:hypothetical protein